MTEKYGDDDNPKVSGKNYWFEILMVCIKDFQFIVILIISRFIPLILILRSLSVKVNLA